MAAERKTVKYSRGKRDPRDPLHGTRYRTKVKGFSEDGDPIFKCVGEGGFSQVYEAESRNLETDAAVKILKHAVADDASTVDRILAEAKNVAQLDHPHIVKVLDVGFTADKRAYIAMEKLTGRTLYDLLEERGRLDPLEAVVCTRQILAAMSYAHKRGIIHRDLKPDNIFLHRPNENDASELCIKVIDFGLAKLLPKTDSQAKFRKLKKESLSGVFLGTPRYAAPEQFMEELPVDQRTDIYAIGLVLYRMIVGSDPFDLFTPEVMGDAKLQFSAQTIVGHLNSLADSRQEPDLKLLAAELPKHLDTIIKKALQRHPSQRYARAEEFDSALAGIERALLAKRPFAPGQACGPYTIVSLMARGHIGDVYLARDGELKRPVAIKTLKLVRETEQEQEVLLQNLRQQARVLANIRHQNLPTMYMAQETSGRYWIATELVTGKSLRELRKQGPLAPDDVVRYAIDIAAGLAAAHAQDILHLDLKPSNVLVTEAGRTIVVDLGLAQALHVQAAARQGASNQTALDQSGANPAVPHQPAGCDSAEVHGSPAYTAPELLRPQGYKEATPRSDIYSLGIILYELLAEHPYQEVLDDPHELIHHHVFVDPLPLEQQISLGRHQRPENLDSEQHQGTLSRELCNIVARCLHKEPGDRFPQMADVVAALEPLIGINEARADFMFEGDNFEHAANAPRGRTLRLGTNTSLPYLLTGQDPSSRDRSSASTSSTDMDSVNSTATTDPVDSTATESPCSIEDEQLSQSHHSASILTPRASLSPGPSSAPVATRRSRPPPPSVTSGVRTLPPPNRARPVTSGVQTLPPPNRARPVTPVKAESELEPSLSPVRCSPTPATLRQTPTATVTKRELRQAQRTTPRSSPPPKLLGHHKTRPRRQRHATQVVAMVAITLVITAVTAMLSSAAIDYLFPRSPALAPPTRSSRPSSIRDRSPAATEPRPPATQRSEPPLDPTAQPQQAEPQQAEPQQAEPRQAEPQQAEPQQAELSPKPRVRKATRMPAKRTTSETQPPPPRPLWLVREPDKRTPATGPEENRDTIAPWED